MGSVGLRCEVFASPREFLQREAADTLSCLVLDVRLPEMSGLDFQAELAGTHADIPIIFITGHGDVPMSVRAMKAGAVEFLTKPVREQTLLDAVRDALECDRVRREQAGKMRDLKARFDSVSPREREVLSLVIAGMLRNTRLLEDVVARVLELIAQAREVDVEQLALPLAHLAGDDDRLDVGALHQRHDRAGYVIERGHVNGGRIENDDVGFFARGQRAGLLVAPQILRAADGSKAQHVACGEQLQCAGRERRIRNTRLLTLIRPSGRSPF